MELQGALNRAIGRGTLLDWEAEGQLLGQQGTLVNQLCRVYDELGREVREMLSLQADLPPRRAHLWTVLTEGENEAWPLLALRDPPAIPVRDTVRLARHLSTVHHAMPPGKAKAWAAHASPGDLHDALLEALAAGETPSWAMLLATGVVVETQHAMLSQWGVLSAYVGLAQHHKQEAALQVLLALQADAALLNDRPRLADRTLWAVLGVLHGWQDCPGRPEIVALAKALRRLNPTEEVVSSLAALAGQVQQALPVLSGEEAHALASDIWSARPDSQRDPSVGISVPLPTQGTAYWLRRSRQVKLIAYLEGQLRAYQWVLMP